MTSVEDRDLGITKLPQGVGTHEFRLCSIESLAELGLERLGAIFASEDLQSRLEEASTKLSTRTLSRYFGSNRGLVEYNATITRSWSNDEGRRERITALSKLFAAGLRDGQKSESLARDLLKLMFEMHVSEHRHEVPVAIMIQSAAQAYLARHEGFGGETEDENLWAARAITRQQRDLFAQAGQWLSDGLTVLLRYLGRRPAAGLTLEQAATAAHAAYDGFLFRHLADPVSLPINDAVEAMFRMFIALSEPGTAYPLDVTSERALLLETASMNAATDDFSLSQVAAEAGVDIDSAVLLFGDTEGLAVETMRWLLGLGPDVVVWGGGQLGVAEAVSAVSTQLDAINSLASRQSHGLVAAAGDRVREVWSESREVVSAELGAIPPITEAAPGIANALVDAARLGDGSWLPVFNAIVLQPSLVGDLAHLLRD